MLGRVLAEDARADADSPPFAKSLRDGYAVRAADCATPGAELQVIAEIAAGAVPTETVGPGECARIFTGAPIPDGADAVVMQEDTQPLDGDRVRITDADGEAGTVGLRPRDRDAGRRRGAAGRHGAQPRGARRAGERRPDACEPLPRSRESACSRPATNWSSRAMPPGPGQIRNSNGPMLAAQAMRAGGVRR